MKHLARILLTVFFAAVLAPFAFGETPVALISKIVAEVTRKHAETDWQKAVMGETLRSGNRVRTGEKSIAIVKFLDNSLVRVRENSEIELSGEVNGKSMSKIIEMTRGAVGFNVKKQRPDEVFQFFSPTSVASIRGTGGTFSLGSVSDLLTVIEGSVLLFNKASSDTILVEEGFTGVSTPEGQLFSRLATGDEILSAEQSSRVSEQDRQIEIDLQDGSGNRRKLKIDFK